MRGGEEIMSKLRPDMGACGWGWCTDGAQLLREVRNKLRQAAADTAQLICEGWLADRNRNWCGVC